MDKQTSGIIEQSMKIKKVNRHDATHFALCNKGNIRYLISMNKSRKEKLCSNLSSYSAKLAILMKNLPIIPFEFLKWGNLGYFVSVELHPEIEKVISKQKKKHWNVIIGTYDEKQKIVIQAFNDKKDLPIYIKVGNEATDREMRNEIEFLENRDQYSTFSIPKLVARYYLKKDALFNIQITEEFSGEKIEVGLTQDIVDIYHEISAICSEEDKEFSHGDFTPWNLKKNKNGYIVYDWEHCGMRLKGFDLLHYVVMPKVMLEKKALSDSIAEGIQEIEKFIPDFKINEMQFAEECKHLRLEKEKL